MRIAIRGAILLTESVLKFRPIRRLVEKIDLIKCVYHQLHGKMTESTTAAKTAIKVSKYIKNAAGHYACPHCDKVTEKQNTMYYHIKKNHDNNLPFECKHCEAHPKFLQKSAFLHHMATMHVDAPNPEGEENPYAGIEFACPTCDHKTHTKANMLVHYARTHCKDWVPAFAKKTSCTGCSKEFASSTAYYYHSTVCFKESVCCDHVHKLALIRS